MRATKIIAILFCFYIFTNLSPVSAEDHDFSKNKSQWKLIENSFSQISEKILYKDNNFVNYNFAVFYGSKNNCKPLFSFSMLQGGNYGARIKQIMMPKGIIKLYVDDKMIFDNIVSSDEYSNGFDFGAPITENMLNPLLNGNVLTVSISIPDKDTSTIKYTLNGSRNAIEAAKQTCR